MTRTLESVVIACPNCRTLLPEAIINTGELHPCPQCRVRVRADVFNAFQQPVGEIQTGEQVRVEGQAECFYHPGKKAVVPCADCGRLLCSLCQVDFDGRSLCLSCLKAGRDKQKFTALDNRRILYDSLALALAFWPMLTIFATMITAPAVIYVVLRYWKVSAGILPRTRFRFILAMLLAIGQIFGWVVFFIGVFS